MNDTRKARTVLVLMVAFAYDYELCPHDALRIARGLKGYPFKAAMHSKRQIAYVVQTDLTARQLVDGLGDALRAGSIERAWAFTPGADIASTEPFDVLTDKVAEAWKFVRRYNHGIPRRQQDRVFHRRTSHPNGRGDTTTPILDHHPLHKRAAAS